MNDTLQFLLARADLWLADPAALVAWATRHSLTPTGAIQPGKTLAGEDLPKPALVNGVCVVPIVGPLVKSASKLEIACGFTSYGGLCDTLAAALATPNLSGILLHCDFPGGSYSGLPEAVDAVATAAKQTRVEVLVDGMAASACFWLAAPAARITAAKSAQVGSIGAVLTHLSVARALSERGVDATVFSSPDGKAAGHPFKQLDAAAAAALQAQVDEAAAEFRDSVTTMRPGIGKGALNGHVFTAGRAHALGLVDSVGESLGAVLSRMTSGTGLQLAAPSAAQFIEKARQFAAAGKTRGEAITAAVAECPAAYEQWLAGRMSGERLQIFPD